MFGIFTTMNNSNKEFMSKRAIREKIPLYNTVDIMPPYGHDMTTWDSGE
jgi:hypothetical protein